MSGQVFGPDHVREINELIRWRRIGAWRPALRPRRGVGQVVEPGGPLIVQGLLDAALATTDATATLKTVQAFDGRDLSDYLDEHDKLTVQNTHKWAGDLDGKALAIYWVAGTPEWRLFQVDCPEEEEEEEEEEEPE